MKVLKILRSVNRRLGISRELLSFFASTKHWWLLPMIIALLVFGTIIIVAQSSAIAPFIYTLF